MPKLTNIQARASSCCLRFLVNNRWFCRCPVENDLNIDCVMDFNMKLAEVLFLTYPTLPCIIILKCDATFIVLRFSCNGKCKKEIKINKYVYINLDLISQYFRSENGHNSF